MMIEYKVNAAISVDQFIDLLQRSTLAERRPVDDHACMEGMISNSNLMVTAWENETLVGIVRSVTDFHYACYLSDLAVAKDFQKKGIGIQLQILTQAQLGSKCQLILIAAPAAIPYYEHIGFAHNDRCWVLNREQRLRR